MSAIADNVPEAVKSALKDVNAAYSLIVNAIRDGQHPRDPSAPSSLAVGARQLQKAADALVAALVAAGK